MVQIAYTNSKCSDIWDMFIKQNHKHAKLPLFFITDELIPDFSEENQFIYDNGDNYSKIWVDTLNKIGCREFIYLQEDFVLYDDINHDKIEEYSDVLNTSEYSFVRLIKSGGVNNKVLSTLYEIEPTNPFIFAMQATIWKTDDYVKVLSGVNESKWLETDKYREYMSTNKIIGLSHYDNEPKRGGNHYDSNVYPYIATALVKGKWITSEYNDQLNFLSKMYNIDMTKRGFI